jgi:hypothetical protein
VVTSRFAGYTPDVHLGADFLEMHIRPLSEEQVAGFVHNWYRIVERGLAKDPVQAEGIAREKAENLIKRLAEQDFRTRRVFELTRNPLLLTNICLVHRHRGQLPQKRARLYEECIDVLLEHWRGAKGLSKDVTAQDGRRVLQPAALWLHGKPERTRATAAELSLHIEPVLKSVGWKRGSAEDFLRTIRDQSGLLTGWGVDQYGFMHLGFQEYLAEWEYACCAGTRSRYYTGDKEEDLDQSGWYSKNSGGRTHPVGEKKPNGWGLYDMHGNVWEWVEDDWHDNYKGAPNNGSAWVDKPRGSYRVIRGGGWRHDAQYCRSATRYDAWPGLRHNYAGFRLSRSVALGP